MLHGNIMERFPADVVNILESFSLFNLYNFLSNEASSEFIVHGKNKVLTLSNHKKRIPLGGGKFQIWFTGNEKKMDYSEEQSFPRWLNPLIPGGNKRSYVLKQTCS